MDRDPHLPFTKGDDAQLKNLSATHLNGKFVVVLFFDTISERFAVEIVDTGKQIKVKAVNLSHWIRNTTFHPEYYRLLGISENHNDDIDTLRELAEGLRTISGITDSQKAYLAANWAGSMLKFQSDLLFKEIVSTMEIVLDSLDDPYWKVVVTTLLAQAEHELKNYDRMVELLEPLVEHHYGQLPQIAFSLFECYKPHDQYEKILQLYMKADELIERKNHCGDLPEQNIQDVYRKFVLCMLLGIDETDSLPIKHTPNVMVLIKVAICKAERVVHNNRDSFYKYISKAFLEYHEGNYDAAIELLEAHNEEIQSNFGSEDVGVCQVLIMMFHCYVEKNDFSNAKYCLKKFKKHTDSEYEILMPALERRLNSINGSTKKKMKPKKIRTKGRCNNPFCLKVEKHEKQFQFCSGCRICKYCSRKCQKIHWKNGHKESCKK